MVRPNGFAADPAGVPVGRQAAGRRGRAGQKFRQRQVPAPPALGAAGRVGLIAVGAVVCAEMRLDAMPRCPHEGAPTARPVAPEEMPGHGDPFLSDVGGGAQAGSPPRSERHSARTP